MNAIPGAVPWHTSTYSGNDGECVEVGETPAAVYVRDSKHPSLTVLGFPADAWVGFSADLKAGRFD